MKAIYLCIDTVATIAYVWAFMAVLSSFTQLQNAINSSKNTLKCYFPFKNLKNT